MVRCPSCGAKNRIPVGRLDQPAKCGKCKTPLEPTKVPHELAPGQLDAIVRNSAIPVLVDFWAPWCGPCRMVAPEVKKVAEASNGRFLVVKVNTEQDPQTAARHRIQSIPLFAVFHRGTETARMAGARPAHDLLRFVEGARTA
ncbi:MAG: thiol reductase thioredoxin [Deltaproteobacteria bacterium]|nr:MAG: thiol reductase thioredoxin [Deltaproteobacteria bacterium]